MKIRDTIERDLGNEPQSVVKVYETARLRTDFTEYVLTDALAREFAKVLEPVIESARPATTGTGKVGIWISGFFGSGKSHFAKIAGHLAADTTITDETGRTAAGGHELPAAGDLGSLRHRHRLLASGRDERWSDLSSDAL